jgi:hypothetical protein
MDCGMVGGFSSRIFVSGFVAMCHQTASAPPLASCNQNNVIQLHRKIGKKSACWMSTPQNVARSQSAEPVPRAASLVYFLRCHRRESATFFLSLLQQLLAPQSTFDFAWSSDTYSTTFQPIYKLTSNHASFSWWSVRPSTGSKCPIPSDSSCSPTTCYRANAAAAANVDYCCGPDAGEASGYAAESGTVWADG